MTCHIGSQWLVIYYNFFGFLLGVSRILDQTRPLLIVLEHGSPYSIASAEDACQPIASRTTSMLDRCCKSKGYFVKKSYFELQTPLEVHFGAFGLPSGGISTCTGQDASQTAPRAPSKCPRAAKRPPVNVNFYFNVNFRFCSWGSSEAPRQG